MIARRTVTQTPITQNVINLIHKAAEMDNNEVEDEENEYDEINSNEQEEMITKKIIFDDENIDNQEIDKI